MEFKQLSATLSLVRSALELHSAFMLRQLDLFDFLKKSAPHSKKKKTTTTIERSDDERMVIHRRPYQRSVNLLVKPCGELKVTAGRGVKENEILRFVEKHRRWIDKQRKFFSQWHEKFPEKTYAEGEEFVFLGERVRLDFEEAKNKKIRVKKEQGRLVLSATRESLQSQELKRKAVRQFYEEQARLFLTQRIEGLAQSLDLHYTALRFRSMKSRWGSCSSQGEICLNLRLIVFKQTIIDYVIIHELCHLVHQNHSSRFWALVKTHYPDYEGAKEELGQNQYEADFLALKTELYGR